MLLTLTRRLLPTSTKQFLRERWRNYQFNRCMRQFSELRHTEPAPKQLLDELVKWWGNEWSARSEYLSAIIDQLRETTGPVLECGSGLSTLLIGKRCQQLGRELWALEHHPGWAHRVEKALHDHHVPCARICLTSLISHGEFEWYDPQVLPVGLQFGVVVCDGPPANTQGGRYGLLPVIGELLLPQSRIYLDDAARSEEQEILQRWQSEYGGNCRIEGLSKPYAILDLT
ncbi:hypothetical protein GC163_12185 [bacterium]|nr:hypothetical protein [bacterium]